MRITNLLFSFKGDIDRGQYLAGWIVVIVLAIIGMFILKAGNPMPVETIQAGVVLSQKIDMNNATQLSSMSALKATVASLISLLLFAFALFGVVAITVKRLRNMGWNVWLAVLLFIPIITHLLTIVCFFVPAKKLRGGF